MEIICIEYAQIDNNEKISEEDTLKDIKIKVIDKQNDEISRVRNVSIYIAEGRHITFIVSDDDIESDSFD